MRVELLPEEQQTREQVPLKDLTFGDVFLHADNSYVYMVHGMLGNPDKPGYWCCMTYADSGKYAPWTHNLKIEDGIVVTRIATHRDMVLRQLPKGGQEPKPEKPETKEILCPPVPINPKSVEERYRPAKTPEEQKQWTDGMSDRLIGPEQEKEQGSWT